MTNISSNTGFDPPIDLDALAVNSAEWRAQRHAEEEAALTAHNAAAAQRAAQAEEAASLKGAATFDEWIVAAGFQGDSPAEGIVAKQKRLVEEAQA